MCIRDRLTTASPAQGRCATAVLDAVSLLADNGVPRHWLYALAYDEQTARQVLGALVTASLLAESADRSTVAVHRLIGRAVREDTHAAGRESDADEHATRAVSYTHLDVYKRQRPGRAARSAAPGSAAQRSRPQRAGSTGPWSRR